MECDDLKSSMCKYSCVNPAIPSSQVHIVMWEKLTDPCAPGSQSHPSAGNQLHVFGSLNGPVLTEMETSFAQRSNAVLSTQQPSNLCNSFPHTQNIHVDTQHSSTPLENSCNIHENHIPMGCDQRNEIMDRRLVSERESISVNNLNHDAGRSAFSGCDSLYSNAKKMDRKSNIQCLETVLSNDSRTTESIKCIEESLCSSSIHTLYTRHSSRSSSISLDSVNSVKLPNFVAMTPVSSNIQKPVPFKQNLVPSQYSQDGTGVPYSKSEKLIIPQSLVDFECVDNVVDDAQDLSHPDGKFAGPDLAKVFQTIQPSTVFCKPIKAGTELGRMVINTERIEGAGEVEGRSYRNNCLQSMPSMGSFQYTTQSSKLNPSMTNVSGACSLKGGRLGEVNNSSHSVIRASVEQHTDVQNVVAMNGPTDPQTKMQVPAGMIAIMTMGSNDKTASLTNISTESFNTNHASSLLAKTDPVVMLTKTVNSNMATLPIATSSLITQNGNVPVNTPAPEVLVENENVTVSGRSSSCSSKQGKKGLYFKLPPTLRKRTQSNYVRDAFLTLNNKKKETIRQETLTPSPSLKGDVTNLSSVKQYLLNKATSRTETKVKFEGLSLASLVNKTSNVKVCDGFSATGLDDSVKSESPGFDSVSEGRRKSAMAYDNFDLKRKLEKVNSLILENDRKRLKSSSKIGVELNLSSENSSLKENCVRVSTEENLKYKSTPKLSNKNMEMVSKWANQTQGGLFENDSTPLTLNPNDLKKGAVGISNEDAVLQDLYDALNIPLSDIKGTMSSIMSDMEDIIQFVDKSEILPTQCEPNLTGSCRSSPGLAENFFKLDW